MKLLTWKERSPEEAAHFNPAFCGALIFEFVKEFEKSSCSGVEFPLPFCALAISMHPKTRGALPKSTITGLYAWLESNPNVKIGFAERIQNLRPYIQEALRYSISRNAVFIGEGGELRVGPKRASFTPSFLNNSTSEIKETVSATKKVARWFSAAGETSSILAAWGVRL